MHFRVLLFVLLIHLVTSKSNQEDLSISSYFHIGCLTLNSDKQWMNNGLQENSKFPYQTFSSPHLTIDLCFRLCRRWTVLISTNHTNCICLYSLAELYEINQSLGEVSSTISCTSDALEIYSLTKDPHLSLSSSATDDWSFDGCYRLSGLRGKHVNIPLIGMNYTSALDSCGKRCLADSKSDNVSFFLSFEKFCYCLPMNISSTISATAIRKPLIHCSFLPYVKNAFNSSFNESSVHVGTVVKVYIQHACSSLFTFDRKLYRCFRMALFNRSRSYLRINVNNTCSPMSVKTIEQYNDLISLLPSSTSRTFIRIDRNSTYLFEDLFKSKVNSFPPGDLCLVIDRTRSPSHDLLLCSLAQSSDYNLCTQTPMIANSINQSQFKTIQPTPILNNITCPTGFILFDNLCYYIDGSLVNDIRAGEDVCSSLHENSTLVKFDSHQRGNTKTARFLGRTFDDILLEFFYYHLEKRLIVETKTNKHWLRLLVGNKKDANGCVLRYFDRATGTFAISPRCDEGGNPICQSKPIPINGIIIGRSGRDNKLWWVMIIILSFVLILLIGIIIAAYDRRRGGKSLSDRYLNSRLNSRMKDLSTPANPNETSDTPAVVYIRLSPSSTSSTTDSYIANGLDHLVINDDEIYLLPRSSYTSNLYETIESQDAEVEDEEEHCYNTIESPNDQ